MATATKNRPAPRKVTPKEVKRETPTQRKKRLVQEERQRQFELVHNKVHVKLYPEDKPMTVEIAKELLGWEEEPEGVEWSADEAMGTGFNKKKFKCLKNPTNRPFRISFARRYASEFIRGKWKMNGETIIIDKYDCIQSGQHRLVGLILAEQLRIANPEKWANDYGLVDEVTAPMIVVYGIEAEADTVDTLDIGQKRSLGDVFYRDKRFEGDTVDKKKLQQLSNILAGAVRLVWIRSGGKKVSDAKHFPHSEGLEFLENHPQIKQAVEYIDLESKKGSSKYIQPAYAAALLYLMAASGTDPDAYEEEGAGAVDMSNWKTACEFWSLFYSGNLKSDDPIQCCKDIIGDIEAASGSARDEIVNTVVKAYNMWVDGKKTSTSKLRLERNDEYKVIEEHRLGGLDVERSSQDEEDDEVEDKPVKAKRSIGKGTKGSKKGKKWAVGDTAWVTELADEYWFGEIVNVADDKKHVTLRSHSDDQEWETTMEHLVLEHP